ncbi:MULTISPECIES: hypothetical protein [Serratia]|uniref:hypothetical protein n=1 Tax=Serratia TaxID=613 RepID=UPI00131A3146|nr:hypothetical protein [Serratia marcescens]ELL0332416.1 hypothetical protein [Serratia marcescens]MBH2548973.1 hypothetical protein [Serratia marcescens]
MKAILFDLDNTLFATQSCSVYLRSRAGRSDVCDLIQRGVVKVEPLDPHLSDYLNTLEKQQDVDVYITSDSPKDYCLAILSKFSINISSDRILGSMHKPCIDVETEELFASYDEVLVVGDTPKDIYLAHRLKVASVFLTSLTDYNVEYSVENSIPTVVANSYQELTDVVSRFIEVGIEYTPFIFKPHFLTVDEEKASIVDISEEDIGFVMRYIPDLDDIKESDDKFTWFKIHRSIKPAKYLSCDELDKKVKIPFYNNNKTITEGMAFKDIAWFGRNNFSEWLKQKKITGKVYLVAAPSSVPRECNKSLPMEMLVTWWVKWFPYLENTNVNLINGCYVERFWPTTPAHMSKGRREVRPHFKTLGVFKNAPPFDADTSAIIIIDDVVTSGTQMKAVASLLQGTGLVPEGVPIYGYALAKTTRTDNHLDFSKLLEAFSKAAKSGG